jgi:hypothetical protein
MLLEKAFKNIHYHTNFPYEYAKKGIDLLIFSGATDITLADKWITGGRVAIEMLLIGKVTAG